MLNVQQPLAGLFTVLLALLPFTASQAQPGQQTPPPPACPGAGSDNVLSYELLGQTYERSGDKTGLYQDDDCALKLANNSTGDYGIRVRYSLSSDHEFDIHAHLFFPTKVHFLQVSIERPNGTSNVLGIVGPDANKTIQVTYSITGNVAQYRHPDNSIYVTYQIMSALPVSGGWIATDDDVDYEWADIDPD